MATNTYVALATSTIVTPASTVTFGSIPAGYTDLVLEINCGISSTGQGVAVSFNSSSTGYSNTFMTGNGSSASSGRNTSQTNLHLVDVTGNGDTAIKTLITANIQNYSNTTTYKTTLYQSQNDGIVQAGAGLWQNTAAISSLVVGTTGGNFVAGSTFTLYGVAAASVGAKATGGTIYSDTNYFYHVFAANGTFTPQTNLSADVLVVAGGGGGGFYGGAGAGGLQVFTSQSLTTTGYTCTVGAGGAGAQSSAGNGVNSTFGSLTASVGGGAGPTANFDGIAGGSGGGAGFAQWFGATKTYGAGTTGQGYRGGSGSGNGGVTEVAGGGGGGAGAVGSSATSNNDAGAGGIGYYSTFTDEIGTATGMGQLASGHYYYAGGGGGTYSFTSGTNGAGGYGGGGVGNHSGSSGAGISNTGGGGGGGFTNGQGNGGSGVVIVRYAK